MKAKNSTWLLTLNTRTFFHNAWERQELFLNVFKKENFKSLIDIMKRYFEEVGLWEGICPMLWVYQNTLESESEKVIPLVPRENMAIIFLIIETFKKKSISPSPRVSIQKVDSDFDVVSRDEDILYWHNGKKGVVFFKK